MLNANKRQAFAKLNLSILYTFVTIQQGFQGALLALGGVRGVPAYLPHPAAGGGAREKRPE
jgi:hypothetical protein